MADNTTLAGMAGGDVIATDDIAGVKHQRVKVEYGADGAATDVSTTTPLPVVLIGGTPVRLYGPAQLSASAATLYTVPTGKRANVTYIRLNNATGNDRTVTMSCGTNAAATQFFTAMTIPANGSLDWTGSIPLAAAEIIQGLASAATAITVIISGTEEAI